MPKKSAKKRGDHRVPDLSHLGPRNPIPNKRYEHIRQVSFPAEDFVYERKSMARRAEKDRARAIADEYEWDFR